jgi:hypothetical protein
MSMSMSHPSASMAQSGGDDDFINDVSMVDPQPHNNLQQVNIANMKPMYTLSTLVICETTSNHTVFSSQLADLNFYDVSKKGAYTLPIKSVTSKIGPSG